MTWRTGGPGGVELFGQTAQLTIENAVWGDISAGGSSGPTRNQVLMELDVILTQKTRALDQDPEARNHIEVLQQVRSCLILLNAELADGLNFCLVTNYGSRI